MKIGTGDHNGLIMCIFGPLSKTEAVSLYENKITVGKIVNCLYLR